ncbi:MAG: metalloregulator ArsR/SmtB family transcription factor [Syntrophomonadaceae bacterium]
MIDRCGIHCIHAENVRSAREQMLPDSTARSLADLFKTLGDITRLKLMVALMHSELCVCDLAAVTGVSESAVSHQLRILRMQDLVRFRRDGKIMYYTLADEHVRALFFQGLEHVNE